MQVQKTVFISYRRTNVFTARAVYQHLTTLGYDAFLDFENIDAGSFEQIILNQVAARAHFVIVLTPSALERCSEPGDWLRREIEYAIDLKRNIVPLMFEDFNFGTMSKYLTDKLAVLSQYNGLPVYSAYFEEAMDRLHTRFLNKPLEMILHPTPPADVPAVRQQQTANAQQATVTEKQLSAGEYFERAYKKHQQGDLAGAIADYTTAIELNPQDAMAYNNRSWVYGDMGNFSQSYADADQAILLKPDMHYGYLNRGRARSNQGEKEGALKDYNEAIRLNPQYANAYNNRAAARYSEGDLDGAMQDYNEALRLNPQYAIAYNGRGNLRYNKGDLDGAIQDYNEAIRLNPQYADAYNNRGLVRSKRGDLDGSIVDRTEAIRIDPQNAIAYNNRGAIRYEKGDLDGAIADYEAALRIDPNYKLAKDNLELARGQKR